MKRLPKTTAIKWLFLVTFYHLLFVIIQAKLYRSCEETRLEIGSSAVDGYYSIELANGAAVSLYCKGKSAVNIFLCPTIAQHDPGRRKRNIVYKS